MSSKIALLALTLALVLWGCSPKKPVHNADSPSASASRTFTTVESQETLEQNQIQAEATAVFTKRAFSELEALAAKYRASKEAYASGSWKLGYLYAGLEPNEDAPLPAWIERVAVADEWMRKRPDSMTARVAKARLLIGYGWTIRSGRWADNVKEKQWTQFFALLQQAVKVLREAKSLSERCPYYWSTWQKAAMGSQMEKAQYDGLFQQAIKEFPDYWPYYQTRAIFLLPRWYGKPGDWEKDLTWSADRLGGKRETCFMPKSSVALKIMEAASTFLRGKESPGSACRRAWSGY